MATSWAAPIAISCARADRDGFVDADGMRALQRHRGGLAGADADAAVGADRDRLRWRPTVSVRLAPMAMVSLLPTDFRCG
jgi:hypothetical protein